MGNTFGADEDIPLSLPASDTVLTAALESSPANLGGDEEKLADGALVMAAGVEAIVDALASDDGFPGNKQCSCVYSPHAGKLACLSALRISSGSSGSSERVIEIRTEAQRRRAAWMGASGGSGGIKQRVVKSGGRGGDGGERGKKHKMVETGVVAQSQHAVQLKSQYVDYVKEVLPWLRNEAGLCGGSCAEVLGCSLNMFYRRGAASKQNMMDELGLGTNRQRGDIDGLTPIADLPDTQCCLSGPCFQGGGDPMALVKLRSEYAAVTTNQEQNTILARILWDPVRGTVLAMCSTSLHLLFGTDRDRISQLKKAVEAAASWNCLPAHGLVDWRRLHPPPNTTPPAIVRLIEQHFDLYTYSNPMDASRRATDPQQRSMTALGDGASKAVGGAVCATTARRYMERLLQRENSKFLPCGIDHNVCPHCKSKRLLIEKLDRECKEARIAKASKECIEALEEGVRRAEAVLEEHISRDLQQRAEIHRWTNVSRELEARERARGIDPNAQHAPCSRDAVRIVHCDDMTTTNHPSTPLDVGGRLAAFPIKVNGQHDMGKEKANILLSGLGAPSKNNNDVMNELILDAALGLNGERVLVIVMDNGPLNRNKHVSGTFGQFLVDHGIVDHVVIIFYWQCHGKGPADHDFGVITLRIKGRPIYSVEDLADTIDSISTLNTFICNPLATAILELHLDARYRIPFVKELQVTQVDAHIIASGHNLVDLSQEAIAIVQTFTVDGVVDKVVTFSTSLYDMVKGVSAGRKGWIRMHRAPGEVRRDYLIYADVPVFKELSSRFPVVATPPAAVGTGVAGDGGAGRGARGGGVGGGAGGARAVVDAAPARRGGGGSSDDRGGPGGAAAPAVGGGGGGDGGLLDDENESMPAEGSAEWPAYHLRLLSMLDAHRTSVTSLEETIKTWREKWPNGVGLLKALRRKYGPEPPTCNANHPLTLQSVEQGYDVTCELCNETILAEWSYQCRDCEEFDVCKVCFTRAGPTTDCGKATDAPPTSVATAVEELGRAAVGGGFEGPAKALGLYSSSLIWQNRDVAAEVDLLHRSPFPAPWAAAHANGTAEEKAAENNKCRRRNTLLLRPLPSTPYAPEIMVQAVHDGRQTLDTGGDPQPDPDGGAAQAVDVAAFKGKAMVAGGEKFNREHSDIRCTAPMTDFIASIFEAHGKPLVPACVCAPTPEDLVLWAAVTAEWKEQARRAPRRPGNGWTMYGSDPSGFRASLIDVPLPAGADRAKELSKRWGKLGVSGKATWNKAAAGAMQQWKKEHAAHETELAKDGAKCLYISEFVARCAVEGGDAVQLESRGRKAWISLLPKEREGWIAKAAVKAAAGVEEVAVAEAVAEAAGAAEDGAVDGDGGGEEKGAGEIRGGIEE